jgi:hypothetical protein
MEPEAGPREDETEPVCGGGVVLQVPLVALAELESLEDVLSVETCAAAHACHQLRRPRSAPV